MQSRLNGRVLHFQMRFNATQLLGVYPCRLISLSDKSSLDDPYFVLGVTRDMDLKDIKKAYFHKAKKYHPDLNPDNERARKMFLQIQSAYRSIENQLDPNVKARRDQHYQEYEASSDDPNFKSRRGTKAKAEEEAQQKDGDFKSRFNFDETSFSPSSTDDFQQERFMRRYRYQHLFTKSSVPMSVRNHDRHGMANLAHEESKPLDRVKIPPWFIYLLVSLLGFCFYFQYINDKSMNIEKLSRENMLKAMRARQESLKYDTKKEITPVESIEMKSLQYKEVVTKQSKKEKSSIQDIKKLVLGNGVFSKSDKSVDINGLINKGEGSK